MLALNKTLFSMTAALLLMSAGARQLPAQNDPGQAANEAPSAAPGAGMVKMVFMLKRKPGMSRADFIKYYETHHRLLGEKYVPNAVRYVRRYLEPVPGPWSKPADEFDVLTELWFANQQEADKAMKHLSEPAIHEEIARDEGRLFDRSRSQVYIITESESALSRVAPR
jgi:EthD domain